eukprot:1084424-Prymnesium_polylepis.1
MKAPLTIRDVQLVVVLADVDKDQYGTCAHVSAVNVIVPPPRVFNVIGQHAHARHASPRRPHRTNDRPLAPAH